MSSSISSFNLPEERFDHVLHAAQLAREHQWTCWLCRLSPVMFLLLLPSASLLLAPCVFLKPVAWETFSLRSLIDLKGAMFAAGISLLPWIWRAGLMIESRVRLTRWPVALLLAMLFIVVASCGIDHPRVRWFIIEWVKIRTPNPSFARNTLFWEQRLFEHSQQIGKPARRISLVGSSQMNQSVNLTLLTEQFDAAYTKNCLAGFGPMQYPWLVDRILEEKPDVVVCWLSEFDFYREEAVITNRLAWASSTKQCGNLWRTLNWRQRWQNRGEFADLSLAANSSLWRHRRSLQRTALNYWWDVSRPSPLEPENGLILDVSADLEGAIANLRENVRRTDFVDVNFASFEQFARELKRRNIQLVVFEGQLNPRARTAYSSDYHDEVDQRLEQMAREVEFHYISGADLLELTAEDFADAYHLSPQGRDRWSIYMAHKLRSVIN